MLTTDNYLQCIGAVIKELRQKADLKQVELAVACDLQRTYIVEVEKGSRKLSLLNLVKIAEALDIPLSKLIAKAEQVSEQ
jgi:transcriptional regulator with XRE-family HTH domain